MEAATVKEATAATAVKELRAALATIKFACNTRSAFEAYAGVRIERENDYNVSLTCTDGDAVAIAYCEATVSGPLDVIVSLKELTALLRGQTGAVLLTQDSAGIQIATTTGLGASLPAITSGEPHWPIVDFTRSDEERVLTADGRELCDAVARVAAVASKDETRPILTGLCLDPEHGKLIATDSWRLLVTDCPGEIATTTKLTIPAKQLAAALKGTKDSAARLTMDRHFVWVHLSDRLVRLRLIDGQYPSYGALIPDHWPSEITFDRTEARRVVSQAAKMQRRNEPLRLAIGDGAVNASLSVPDGPSMEADIAVRHIRQEADDVTLGVNPEFLRDGLTLTSSGTAEVSFQYISALRPMLIASEHDQYLIMPIRLNS